MKQGTVSVLFGCHSVVHSKLVLSAWIKLYGWPKWWEVVCIFIHDIGHWGKDYLDDYEEKKAHWKLGARLAGWLFGREGYVLIAGHAKYSAVPLSRLYLPDKYSWVLAPTWWLLTTSLVEPKLRRPGMKWRESVAHFKKMVRENAENGFADSTHEIYLRDWAGGYDATQ